MGTRLVVGTNDLATTHPELSKQWNTIRNGEKSPKDFLSGSGQKVWWICSRNHEWEATPATRSKGIGCPYCSNQKALAGFNDLATIHPNLIQQWNFSRNGTLQPSEVVAGSNKAVWWICDKGHEWETKVSGRTKRNSGCPVCSNNTLLPGFNDLATTNPPLAEQWSYDRNAPLTPKDVSSGSNKKYWWVCHEGHEWEQSPNIRTRGNGCPFCSHQRLLPGFNDLATVKPDLASQWDTKKNGLRPDQVMSHARVNAWWLCDQGHSWQSPLRGRKQGKCPTCLNRVFIQGFNDLLSKHPDIAKQWDRKRNGDLTPETVPSTSRTAKYWWKCAQNHSWEATLASRKTGNSCPVCSGQLLIPGLNDMATTHPEIAATFHLEKNFPATPEQIFAGAGKSFWWQCENGHEWKTTANSRFNGKGCPTCAEYGFKPHKPALFYFIENVGLSAKKVGITNSEERRVRLNGFAKRGWKEVLIVESQNGEKILALEKAVLTWIRKDLSIPSFLTSKEMGRQGGWTETFAAESLSNQAVTEKIMETMKELGIR